MRIDEKYKPILEAIKEPLRLLVLAIIPFALSYLEVFNAEWAVAITVILRYLDKALHEYGKQIESDNLVKGITRF